MFRKRSLLMVFLSLSVIPFETFVAVAADCPQYVVYTNQIKEAKLVLANSINEANKSRTPISYKRVEVASDLVNSLITLQSSALKECQKKPSQKENSTTNNSNSSKNDIGVYCPQYVVYKSQLGNAKKELSVAITESNQKRTAVSKKKVDLATAKVANLTTLQNRALKNCGNGATSNGPSYANDTNTQLGSVSTQGDIPQLQIPGLPLQALKAKISDRTCDAIDCFFQHLFNWPQNYPAIASQIRIQNDGNYLREIVNSEKRFGSDMWINCSYGAVGYQKVSNARIFMAFTNEVPRFFNNSNEIDPIFDSGFINPDTTKFDSKSTLEKINLTNATIYGSKYPKKTNSSNFLIGETVKILDKQFCDTRIPLPINLNSKYGSSLTGVTFFYLASTSSNSVIAYKMDSFLPRSFDLPSMQVSEVKLLTCGRFSVAVVKGNVFPMDLEGSSSQGMFGRRIMGVKFGTYEYSINSSGIHLPVEDSQSLIFSEASLSLGDITFQFEKCGITIPTRYYDRSLFKSFIAVFPITKVERIELAGNQSCPNFDASSILSQANYNGKYCINFLPVSGEFSFELFFRDFPGLTSSPSASFKLMVP